MDPEEEGQLEAAARPPGVFAGSEGKDFRVLAAGTAQNIVGLAVFVVGTFAANILISRAFGGDGAGAVALGIVTIGTQFAFIVAAGHPLRDGHGRRCATWRSRSGAGHPGRVRPVVARRRSDRRRRSRSPSASLTFALAGPIGRALGDAQTAEQTVGRDPRGRASRSRSSRSPTSGSAGSRGLKVMRHTLYVQWVAQPLLWIVLMLVFWQIDKTEADGGVGLRGVVVLSAVGGAVLLELDQRRASRARSPSRG